MKRNMGRTLFVILSVTLAAFVTLVVMSVLQGMSNNLRSAVVLNNTGDVQIQEQTYAKLGLPQSPLEYTSLLKKDFQKNGIHQFSPELVMEGYLSTPEGDAALTVLGIDPALHSAFIPLSKTLSSGSFFEGNEPTPIVIGEELASEFHLKVGESLVLNFQDKSGGLRSELMNVAGIYHYSSRSFQLQEVYILQRDWQTFYFGEDSGKILFNRIPVMMPVSKSIAVKDMTKDLTTTLKSWRDENPEMSVAVDFNNLMIRFCILIIFFTAFLTILGPVQILWEEREAELKMLTILGIGKKDVFIMALLELCLVFILSSACVLIFLGAFFIIFNQGLDLNFLNKGIRIERAGIIIDWLIHPSLDMFNIILTSLLVISILFFSYFWGVTAVMKKILRGIA